MYGYREAAILLHRELQVQSTLAQQGKGQVLHIPATFGPVGGGKTSMHINEALEWDLTWCAFNSGENSDATDLSGVPVPSMIGNLLGAVNDEGVSMATRADARGKYMMWVLNKYAALACIQAVYLFFDDLDKAPPPVQAALLGIFANRQFRDQALHPGTLIACAGNRTEDDETAYEISESLRTRLTIIPMSPDLASFSTYAKEAGLQPTITGFLQYKPEFLHQWKEGVYRFPTPRGWWECSQMMDAFPLPEDDIFSDGSKNNWKHIVSQKCGDHVANDYWAWFKIISLVKPEEVLRTGVVTHTSSDTNARRMFEYAAIFAVANHLSVKGVHKRHTGLNAFISGLGAEMQVAFIVQLPMAVRSRIGKMFPAAANTMMANITKMYSALPSTAQAQAQGAP